MIKNILDKYQVFIKYIGVAILSFLIDILFFSLFNHLFLNILLATILARIISSFFNFLANRNHVFKSNKNIISLIEYYILVVFQMLASGIIVSALHNIIPINATLIKIPVEFGIFMVNYLIQKYLIFR